MVHLRGIKFHLHKTTMIRDTCRHTRDLAEAHLVDLWIFERWANSTPAN